MKLPVILLFCATVAFSHAHDAPAPGASEPKRFNVVVNGKEEVYRIDTATGRSWRLEIMEGRNYAWVPISETLFDPKSGAHKPAPLNDALAAPQPEKTR